MKKLTTTIVLAAAALAGFCSTNEAWYVVHRESARYCELAPTNMPDRAGLVVTRLGRSNGGVPAYSSAELVRLFGGDEIDGEFAEKVDRTFLFWSAPAKKGVFLLRQASFKDILRSESAGDAD